MAFLDAHVPEPCEGRLDFFLEQEGVVVDWHWSTLRGTPGPAILIVSDDDDSTLDRRIPVHLVAGVTTEVTVDCDR